MTTRDEYVAKLKRQLDSWNADMAAWEEKARSAQEDAKKHYDEQLKVLAEQRAKAQYNLTLLESATAAAWEDISRGADEAWERMREAVAQARTHFEKR